MQVLPQRLSVLLAVHRAGGVVAAADILHITPSAVSQQIRLLERECGTRVLDRTPTGAVLTAAGKVLADAAERIEDELTTVILGRDAMPDVGALVAEAVTHYGERVLGDPDAIEVVIHAGGQARPDVLLALE